MLAGNHLSDGLEAMLLIPRINSLWRIANGEVSPATQTRSPLQNRRAVFLDRAGIEGRFVDNDVSSLEIAPHRLRGMINSVEIRAAGAINRGGNGDYIKIRLRQCVRFAGIYERRLRQF